MRARWLQCALLWSCPLSAESKRRLTCKTTSLASPFALLDQGETGFSTALKNMSSLFWGKSWGIKHHLRLDFGLPFHHNGCYICCHPLGNAPTDIPGTVPRMIPSQLDNLLKEIEGRISYRFSNRQLLFNALVHRSYVNENPHLGLSNNERLEFLGDAVLDLAVSHLLIGRFPYSTEGELSRLRAGLVNERQLAILAEELRLGEALALGKGEDLSGGRQKPSLLANAYEAVLAAVYLDGGLDALMRVVEAHFSRFFSEEEDLPQTLDKDYKTRLQEVLQGREKVLPDYRPEAEEGPDHSKIFRVSVWVRDRLLAFGSGATKKAAQQKAAGRALRLLESEIETKQ
jgi:ribonuclease-3